MDEASKMVNVSAPSLFRFSPLSAEWQEATSSVETKSGGWKKKKKSLFDLVQQEGGACKATGLQGF